MVLQPFQENHLLLDDFHQTLAKLIYVHEVEPKDKVWILADLYTFYF